MISLLRMFAAFRRLEAESVELRESLQEAVTEKLVLQDRLDQVLNDRAELWDMVKTSIGNERDTYQTEINMHMQQRFGIKLFPDAASLPPSMEAGSSVPPIARRQMPSEMIGSRKARFAKEYLKRHTSTVERVPDPS